MAHSGLVKNKHHQFIPRESGPGPFQATCDAGGSRAPLQGIGNRDHGGTRPSRMEMVGSGTARGLRKPGAIEGVTVT